MKFQPWNWIRTSFAVMLTTTLCPIMEEIEYSINCIEFEESTMDKINKQYKINICYFSQEKFE